jgi:hypothetical protein
MPRNKTNQPNTAAIKNEAFDNPQSNPNERHTNIKQQTKT